MNSDMDEMAIDQRILGLLESMSYILDIGCGDGRLVNALVTQNQKRVIGLDISNHGFGQAKKMAIQAASPHLVECVEYDARRIAFREDYFEAVILTFSLHHIEETGLALQEIHRILAPGGIVLIGEWVVEDEDQPREGCYRFTLREMDQMLEKTGFQQVRVEQIEIGLALIVGQVPCN